MIVGGYIGGTLKEKGNDRIERVFTVIEFTISLLTIRSFRYGEYSS